MSEACWEEPEAWYKTSSFQISSLLSLQALKPGITSTLIFTQHSCSITFLLYPLLSADLCTLTSTLLLYSYLMQVFPELANWVQTSLTILKIKTLAGGVNCKSKILHDRLTLLALVYHHATISRVCKLQVNLHSKCKYHRAADTRPITEQGVRCQSLWTLKIKKQVPKVGERHREQGKSCTVSGTIGSTWITEPAVRCSWEPCAGSTARPACHTTSSAAQQGLKIPVAMRWMPLCAESSWDHANVTLSPREHCATGAFCKALPKHLKMVGAFTIKRQLVISISSCAVFSLSDEKDWAEC